MDQIQAQNIFINGEPVADKSYIEGCIDDYDFSDWLKPPVETAAQPIPEIQEKPSKDNMDSTGSYEFVNP